MDHVMTAHQVCQAMATCGRRLGYAGYLLLVVGFATAVSAVVGYVVVFVIGFPFTLLGLGATPQFLFQGVIWAAPVTLILLPAIVILGHRHSLILYFSLPFVGLGGGALAMKIWPFIHLIWAEVATTTKSYMTSPRPGDQSAELLVIAGAVAGLAAGIIFSAAVREAYR